MRGYLITYYKGQKWIDQDHLLGIEDVEDHVRAAMEIEECDLITVHCVDDGDVLYTYEVFLVDDKWIEFYNNQVMGVQSLNTL